MRYGQSFGLPISLFQTFIFLLVAQFLLGIGEAVGTPAFDVIFAEHLDKGKHINEYSDGKLSPI